MKIRSKVTHVFRCGLSLVQGEQIIAEPKSGSWSARTLSELRKVQIVQVVEENVAVAQPAATVPPQTAPEADDAREEHPAPPDASSGILARPQAILPPAEPARKRGQKRER